MLCIFFRGFPKYMSHVFALFAATSDTYLYEPYSGQRVGYNNMIYSEGEIERIARVAGEFG